MTSSAPITCLTCRIRKKKCDKKQPECTACCKLGITCYSGSLRNSDEYDDLANSIRAQIKHRAAERRHKGFKTPANQGLSGDSLSKDIDPSTDIMSGMSLESETVDDINVDFEIIFLDYVFPFLFPFYHPSIFEGGRCWLPATLKSSRPLFHSAMSLSSYFFALILNEGDDKQHDICKRQAWEEFLSHVDNATRSVRVDMADIGTSTSNVSIFEKTRLMASIVQLLIFEMCMSRTMELDVHIEAAIALLSDILEMYGTGDSGTSLYQVLATMGKPGGMTVLSNTRVWNMDQAAFRFFVAFLLYADIVSSTTIGNTPRLRKYHTSLIDCGSGSCTAHSSLQLESFIGCQGWVLLLLGDAATLVSRRHEGEISSLEMLIEGSQIAHKLQEGIANLNKCPTCSPKCAGFLHPYPNLKSVYPSVESILHSQIWAHAASIYLFVSLSGWQPDHEAVREAVEATLCLLGRVSSPAMLHNLAWPFCIAGCLASRRQEGAFRDIASRLGSLIAFGTFKDALCLVEKVWQMRGQMDIDDWDFTRCFRILDARALLF
ncbi:fungal-specific transcription factor domain-containing protein [Trichoderma sp. SZMC 28015]